METYQKLSGTLLLLWVMLLGSSDAAESASSPAISKADYLVWGNLDRLWRFYSSSKLDNLTKNFQNIDYSVFLGMNTAPQRECIVDQFYETNTLQKLNYWLFREDNIRAMLLIINGLMIDFWILFNLGHFLITGDSLSLIPSLGGFYLFRFLALSFGHWPFPKNYIFEHPGFDSLFIPYDDTNDFFFSGHTGLVIILFFNCWFYLTKHLKNKKINSQNNFVFKNEFIQKKTHKAKDSPEVSDFGSDKTSKKIKGKNINIIFNDDDRSSIGGPLSSNEPIYITARDGEISEFKRNEKEEIEIKNYIKSDDELTPLCFPKDHNILLENNKKMIENQELKDFIKPLMISCYNKTIIWYSLCLVVLTVSLLLLTHAHYSNDILIGLVMALLSWTYFFKYRFDISLLFLKAHCAVFSKIKKKLS